MKQPFFVPLSIGWIARCIILGSVLLLPVFAEAPSAKELKAALLSAESREAMIELIDPALARIDGPESTAESRVLLELQETLTAKGFSTAALVQRADETGNRDLLDFAAGIVKSADYDAGTEWREAVMVSSRIHSAVVALAKWKHPTSEGFLAAFLRCPDVPFGQVQDWHFGFTTRGLPGTFAEGVVRSGGKDKQNLYEMLGDPSVSEAKKRVIVYAMKFDESEDATVLLRQIREVGNEVFASEAMEVIRNRGTTRE